MQRAASRPRARQGLLQLRASCPPQHFLPAVSQSHHRRHKSPCCVGLVHAGTRKVLLFDSMLRLRTKGFQRHSRLQRLRRADPRPRALPLLLHLRSLRALVLAKVPRSHASRRGARHTLSSKRKVRRRGSMLHLQAVDDYRQSGLQEMPQAHLRARARQKLLQLPALLLCRREVTALPQLHRHGCADRRVAGNALWIGSYSRLPSAQEHCV